MSKEQIYVDGIKVFAPHGNAPEFIKGTVVITPSMVSDWCKNNQGLLREYNGNKQIRLELREGSNGLYMTVDTFGLDVAEEKEQASAGGDEGSNDLPF